MATGATEFINPGWLIQQSNAAMTRLWPMCAGIGIGSVLIAASTMWISLTWRSSGFTATKRPHDPP